MTTIAYKPRAVPTAMDCFVDINFRAGLNPLRFAKLIMHKLHGFGNSTGDRRIAIDFPAWIPSSKLMTARIGNKIRLIGAKDSLLQFLKTNNLMTDLILEGIDVQGAQAVPETVLGYVQVGRTRVLERYERIISGREPLYTDDSDDLTGSGAAPSLSQEQRLEELALRYLEIKKNSATLNMVSKSTTKTYALTITRKALTEKPDEDFSSFGLAKAGSGVPFW